MAHPSMQLWKFYRQMERRLSQACTLYFGAFLLVVIFSLLFKSKVAPCQAHSERQTFILVLTDKAKDPQVVHEFMQSVATGMEFNISHANRTEKVIQTIFLDTEKGSLARHGLQFRQVSNEKDARRNHGQTQNLRYYTDSLCARHPTHMKDLEHSLKSPKASALKGVGSFRVLGHVHVDEEDISRTFILSSMVETPQHQSFPKFSDLEKLYPGLEEFGGKNEELKVLGGGPMAMYRDRHIFVNLGRGIHAKMGMELWKNSAGDVVFGNVEIVPVAVAHTNHLVQSRMENALQIFAQRMQREGVKRGLMCVPKRPTEHGGDPHCLTERGVLDKMVKSLKGNSLVERLAKAL